MRSLYREVTNTRTLPVTSSGTSDIDRGMQVHLTVATYQLPLSHVAITFTLPLLFAITLMCSLVGSTGTVLTSSTSNANYHDEPPLG